MGTFETIPLADAVLLFVVALEGVPRPADGSGFVISGVAEVVHAQLVDRVEGMRRVLELALDKYLAPAADSGDDVSLVLSWRQSPALPELPAG